MNVRATRARRVVVAACIGVLAACSGGGSSASSTSSSGSSASPPPSTASSSSNPDAAIAAAATLTAADLGPRYVVDTPAQPAASLDACSTAGGSNPLTALPLSSSQLGALLHRDGTKWYINSFATVFPDEASAQAWMALRAAPAFVECLRAEIEAGQKKANPQVSVETRTNTSDESGAHDTYQLRFDDGSGIRDANGQFDRYALRHGRVVLLIGVDVATSSTDPADVQQTFGDDFNGAIDAALARLPA